MYCLTATDIALHAPDITKESALGKTGAYCHEECNVLPYHLLRNFVQTSYHLLKAHLMDLPLLCTARFKL